MLKITKTYTDYNDVEKTEDFYFHLTEAELLDMETETEGGFIKTVEAIAKAKNTPELMKLFKKLLLKSYGEKTPDGGFLKTDEILQKFIAKKAFSDIYVELATSDEKAADFINRVIPEAIRVNEQSPEKSN